jgi:hypothetical protein
MEMPPSKAREGARSPNRVNGPPSAILHPRRPFVQATLREVAEKIAVRTDHLV